MDAGGTSVCVIQSDQEMAIAALLRQVSDDFVIVTFGQSPAHSSEPQGAAEHLHQRLQGQSWTSCHQQKHHANLQIDSCSRVQP